MTNMQGSGPDAYRSRWGGAAVRASSTARGPLVVAFAIGTALLASGCTSGGSTAVSSASGSASASASASTSAGGSASSGSSTASSSARSTTSSAAVTSGAGAGTGSGTDAAGPAYCESKGGQAQTRDATFGTNGPQTAWLPMAGTTQVCRFQADDEARSRIYVDFATLTSARPTLAGLAYLARPPLPASNGGANPATGYCTTLGGSSTFGEISANGGGWVAKDDPDDVVVNLCVFPDLSYIDEWGLAYHAGGVVRGQDLTQVMTYRPPNPLPDIFPVGTPTEQPTTGSSAVGGAQSSPVTSAGVPSSSSAPTS